MHEGASSSDVEFTVNTSFIGRPGWTDDIAVIGGISIVIVFLLVLIFKRLQVRWGSRLKKW
jgi:hypothetical protein